MLRFALQHTLLQAYPFWPAMSVVAADDGEAVKARSMTKSRRRSDGMEYSRDLTITDIRDSTRLCLAIPTRLNLFDFTAILHRRSVRDCCLFMPS